MFFKRKGVRLFLAFVLAVNLFSNISGAPGGARAQDTQSFTDVPASHWAYEPIQRAADNGWVKGVGNDRFDPNGTVSNVQWIVMVTRAFYADEVERIAILGNSERWWSPYCSAAAVNGVLEATTIGDSYFEAYKWDEDLLNTPISRYDMAQVALNYMSDNNFTVSEREKKAAQAKIGDWAEIPVEYRDGVSACYALGVISGRSDGTFGGAYNMSRAEAATVLCWLADATGKGSTPAPTPEPAPEPTPTPTPSGTYAPADANQDGILTEDEVYEALMLFKEEVPEDTPWGDDKYYQSPVGGRTYGCAAFVYMASDRAFGRLPERVVSDINNLRIGDFFCNKTSNFEHWGIIIGLGDGDYFYKAEGNVNGVATWTGMGSYSAYEEAIALGTVTFYSRYPQ